MNQGPEKSQVGAESVAYDPDRLKEFIQGMENIPTLPAIAARLLHMAHDSDVGLAEISRLMSTDPALSARVLKIVNSAYFSLPRSVTSVRDAVVLLGLDSLRQVCLSVSVMGILRGSTPAVRSSTEKVWKHSLGAGLAGRALAVRIRLKEPEEAFTGARLHDIGRVLLLEFAPKETIRAALQAEKEHTSILEQELLELGFDHRHVGGWIASYWKLPEQILSAVMWHHNPEAKHWKSEDEGKLVTVVALANEIANFKDLCFAKAAPDIDLMATLRKLNIEPDELMETMEGLEDEVEEFQKMLK